MNVMSAKQTMICSFSVGMLAPREKHSWYFCFFSSLPCTCRRSGLTLYSVYWWETECNKKQALSKYLGFRKSCFNFYKAWSQNAAAGSLCYRLPLVCIWASVRRSVWGWQPLVHTCKLCHFTHRRSLQLCLVPSTTEAVTEEAKGANEGTGSMYWFQGNMSKN